MTGDALRRLSAPDSWCPGISDDTGRAVAAVTRFVSYARGSVVVLEGDRCGDAKWVVTGMFRVRQSSPEGREHVLAYAGPGQAVNLAVAVSGETELATVDAVQDGLIGAIGVADLRRLLAEYHDLSRAVTTVLAREVCRLTLEVRALALDTVRMRLARFLLREADSSSPRLRWTQESIAAQIGTVRDVVGRLLRSFADDGLVRRQRGQLILVDRERLERYAQE